MEKESSFVKGEKEKYTGNLKYLLQVGLLSFATLSPFTHSVKAQKQDFEPPHPLSQRNTAQPINQAPQPAFTIAREEQIPTQKSLELSPSEVIDPFSQEGKLENFVAGYGLMDKKGKNEIKKQIFTTESGTTIFVSKRTTDRVNTSHNPPLGMKEQLFTTIALSEPVQKKNPLESYVNNLEQLSDLSLGDESFVVVDEEGTNRNIIIWSMGPDGIRERAKSIGSIYYAPSCTVSLYHNKQLLSLPDSISLIPNYPIRGTLAPFMVRSSWDYKNNQLVYADEISIFADFNQNKIDPKLETLPATLREIPTLLGDVHARLKANLKRYLKLTEPWKSHNPSSTIFFTHPEEIRNYLATDDISYLQHLNLFPNQENPGFFALLSGTFGFKNPEVLDIVEKSIQKLSHIDPSLLITLNQWGNYIFIPQGRGDYVGSIRINEAIGSFYASDTESIDNSSINILKQAQMNNFTQMSNLKRAPLNITPSPVCVGRSVLSDSADFLFGFAEKYQEKMDTQFYTKLIETANAERGLAQSLTGPK